jgi:hypothetical protein
MLETLPEFICGVSLIVLGVRDGYSEAYFAAFGDRQSVGRRVSLVGQLAIQRTHLDTKPHRTPWSVRAFHSSAGVSEIDHLPLGDRVALNIPLRLGQERMAAEFFHHAKRAASFDE